MPRSQEEQDYYIALQVIAEAVAPVNQMLGRFVLNQAEAVTAKAALPEPEQPLRASHNHTHYRYGQGDKAAEPHRRAWPGFYY